jgi:hypothetical protein
MIDQNQLCWAYLSPVSGVEGDCHVIPENDLIAHEIASDCWCNPVDDHHSPDYVWLHNAKDGREDYEKRSRKPN